MSPMTLLDSFLSRFGRLPATARDGQSKPPAFPASTSFAPTSEPRSLQQSRRDLLRIALRDVKARLGIPGEWVQMHAMGVTSSRRGQGMHACLSVHHWHPLLMLHAPSIERMLMQRTILIDPAAVEWLIGVSWKFELDPQLDLGPFPPTSAWTADRHAPARQGVQAVSLDDADQAGLIAGPVFIPAKVPSARDRLDAHFAAGDSLPRLTTGLEPTEPAELR